MRIPELVADEVLFQSIRVATESLSVILDCFHYYLNILYAKPLTVCNSDLEK